MTILPGTGGSDSFSFREELSGELGVKSLVGALIGAFVGELEGSVVGALEGSVVELPGLEFPASKLQVSESLASFPFVGPLIPSIRASSIWVSTFSKIP